MLLLLLVLFCSILYQSSHCLTSILGSISCDSVDRQVGLDVPGADHSHWDPVALDLCPQAVEVGLGGVLGGSI